MDPALDPPPLPAEPPAVVPATSAAAANPTPTAQPPAHNHPPYAEMITAAITNLKEKNGSSKRAIVKYIQTNYSNLPQTHPGLLTHHLKRLKASGQIAMVKHSYKLPRSAPAAVNGSVNAVASDPASAGSKRRPGRPPKVKPDTVQAAVPVFPPSMDMNAAPEVVPVAQNVSVGPGNGDDVGGGVRRGRGRPPGVKVKRKPGRPPKAGGATVPAVRPTVNSAPAIQGKRPGRPRGRPPKLTNGGGAVAPVASSGAVAAASPVSGRRRGRPPKAGGTTLAAVQPKKARNSSGKPVGRPRKNASATATATRPDSQLLVAYLDLKAKLENLQLRVHQTATFIRPTLNSAAAVTALEELQMAAASINGPSTVQIQNQQPPQEQLQQPDL